MTAREMTNKDSAEVEKSAYGTAIKRFEEAADRLNRGEGMRQPHRAGKRELPVNFPALMNNAGIKVFSGYPVPRNQARGPAGGGIRYSPIVTPKEELGTKQEQVMKSRFHNRWNR